MRLDPDPEQEQLPLFASREAGAQAPVPTTTHPAAVVADFDDGLVLPEIPHNCLAIGVSRGQNVLDLAVPRQCFNVFWGVLRQDGKRDNLPSPELSDASHFTPPSGPQEAEGGKRLLPLTALGSGTAFSKKDASAMGTEVGGNSWNTWLYL